MFAVVQSSPGCPSLALEAWALQLGGRHLTHHMQASQALQRAGRSMGRQGTASALTELYQLPLNADFHCC